MDSTDKRLLKLLHTGLPVVEQPYRMMGETLGIDEQEVLQRIRNLKADGAVRKITALIPPRKVGMEYNAMTIWVVPEDRIEEVGKRMAQFDEVSHCYQRPTVPGKWPYSLFCMIHQPTKEGCEQIAKRIADTVGIHKYKLLYSTKGSHQG